jgi:signal transduction protein with GAF and PtsI domain
MPANAKKAADLEQRLARNEQQLQMLQSISRLMVRKLSLAEVLHEVVALVKQATAADSCLIYLHDGDDMVLCASDTPHPGQIGHIRLKFGEGITGWVAKERRMVAISQGAQKDPRFRVFHDLPEDTYEAFLSVPIIVRNEVVGVINVQHRQTHRHTGNELEMMITAGEQVGCVIVLAEMGDVAYSELHPVERILSSPPRRQ